jgi:hypothetical protein
MDLLLRLLDAQLQQRAVPGLASRPASRQWEHELLEESSDIHPRSLRRQDSTITWRRGEATRSASLR